MHNYDKNDFDTTLDGLMEFLDSLPKAKLKILNPSKYILMLQTAVQLTNLLQETTRDIKLNLKLNHLFNLGAITVELNTLTIDNPRKFTEIISAADNIEVYPLTNGRIKLDLTFQSVLKTVM